MTRTALVHEWMDSLAGSEQTFLAMAEALPDADLYALTRAPSIPELQRPIRTTWLDHDLLRMRRGVTLPLMPLAWRTMRAPAYDVVVTSSHAFSRAFRPAADAIHLSYTYTPARYLWQPEIDRRGLPRPLEPARAALRRLDLRYSRSVDRFAAISHVVQDRIQQYYGREADVIFPPVDTAFFAAIAPRPLTGRGPLVSVGRFIEYKRHDLAIDAAERAGLPIIVAGHGALENELRQRASAARVPVQIVVQPSREELRALYGSASALVFASQEDFGIVPVEAQACGTPVVALADGGTADTVVHGTTGWLVEEQTVEAFADGIKRLLDCALDPASMVANAARFDRSIFLDAFRNWVETTVGER